MKTLLTILLFTAIQVKGQTGIDNAAWKDDRPTHKGYDTIPVLLLCSNPTQVPTTTQIYPMSFVCNAFEVREIRIHNPPLDNMFNEQPEIYYVHKKYLTTSKKLLPYTVWQSKQIKL